MPIYTGADKFSGSVQGLEDGGRILATTRWVTATAIYYEEENGMVNNERNDGHDEIIVSYKILYYTNNTGEKGVETVVRTGCGNILGAHHLCPYSPNDLGRINTGHCDCISYELRVTMIVSIFT